MTTIGHNEYASGRARETAGSEQATGPLVSVHGLTKHFPVTRGVVLRRQVAAAKAVDGIDLDIRPGETLGLVGESGCGKSTVARMLVKLIEPTDGQIVFEGRDITHLSEARMRPLRRDVQIIFQDPYSSLNPRHTVGSIVGAPMRVNSELASREIPGRVKELLATVGLNPEHYNRYPHEFSGGQRQRIGIARALSLRPKLVVADEPVSALDVSVQAQVLNLLRHLQKDFGLTYVFISHNLAVVRHVSTRIAVMYLGKIVEYAERDSFYAHPRHPYSSALLSAVPVAEAPGPVRRERIMLGGDVPTPLNPPSGCRFRTRCWKAQEVCSTVEPPLQPTASGHQVACHFPL